MNSRQDFYSRIQQQHSTSEVASILSTDPDCGFDELCLAMLAVVRNASIIKQPDNTLRRIFHDEDIANAKQQTRAFAEKYAITDIPGYLRILQMEFAESTDDPLDLLSAFGASIYGTIFDELRAEYAAAQKEEA